MKTIHNLDNLRHSISLLRQNRQPIALVPTMGALHEGHLSLVREAKKATPNVIVSIFVNPAQFGAGEDLGSYPKQLKTDSMLLRSIDIPILWAPEITTIYPKGFATAMHIKGLDDNLCGAKRPGHFDGVMLIVAKLFNQTGADIAFFGEKDYQQLSIIRQMALDLDFNIKIVSVPTVRNAAGLALSSRNKYLNADELIIASALPQSLQEAAIAIQNGENIQSTLMNSANKIVESGFNNIDYINLIDARSLKILEKWNGQDARLIAAAFIGTTRLIDNISIK